MLREKDGCVIFILTILGILTVGPPGLVIVIIYYFFANWNISTPRSTPPPQPKEKPFIPSVAPDKESEPIEVQQSVDPNYCQNCGAPLAKVNGDVLCSYCSSTPLYKQKDTRKQLSLNGLYIWLGYAGSFATVLYSGYKFGITIRKYIDTNIVSDLFLGCCGVLFLIGVSVAVFVLVRRAHKILNCIRKIYPYIIDDLVYDVDTLAALASEPINIVTAAVRKIVSLSILPASLCYNENLRKLYRRQTTNNTILTDAAR